MENTRAKGKIAEELAEKFLLENGYKILDKNFHCGNKGEIDLIALDVAANTIAIIEVKSRTNLEMGYPEVSVTKSKRIQVKKMAEYYVNVKEIKDTLMRFDVISVLFGQGDKPEIIHMKDAFY